MFRKSVVPGLFFALCLVFSLVSWAADARFRAAQLYASGGYDAYSVAVGDMNGDGKADLIVANQCVESESCSTGGVVGVLLGNGDGSFQSVHTYSSGGIFATMVAVADVNGDGKLDVLVTNTCLSNKNCLEAKAPGSIGVLLGKGDGSLQDPVHPYQSGGIGSVEIAVADVNGDGNLDLLVTNFCGDDAQGCHRGTWALLLGNGDGTFQPAQIHDSGGYGPDFIAVADVNGDGKLDVFVTVVCPVDNFNCSRGGMVSVFLGNGDGSFQSLQTYNSGGFRAQAVAVADVNGDGKLDLVVTNRCHQGKDACNNNHLGAGIVAVLLGNGDGTFQSVRRYSSGGYGAGALALADVNSDDKLDVLVVNACGFNCPPSSDIIAVLLGNGDGGFQKAQRYITEGYGSGPGALAVKDVNGDGKLDLLVANECFPFGWGCGQAGGVAVLLGRYVTSTSIASNENPANYGQPVTLTTQVSSDGLSLASAPSGTVTFQIGNEWLGKATLSNGVATLTTTKLPVGSLSITARYNGDIASMKSKSPELIQVVNP